MICAGRRGIQFVSQDFPRHYHPRRRITDSPRYNYPTRSSPPCPVSSRSSSRPARVIQRWWPWSRTSSTFHSAACQVCRACTECRRSTSQRRFSLSANERHTMMSPGQRMWAHASQSGDHGIRRDLPDDVALSRPQPSLPDQHHQNRMSYLTSRQATRFDSTRLTFLPILRIRIPMAETYHIISKRTTL
jgi:hypothetical protein